MRRRGGIGPIPLRVALAGSLLAVAVHPAGALEVVWSHQFGTARDDAAGAVAVDVAGQVFVVGETWGALPGQTNSGAADAFVRRYDAAGDQIWTRQFGTSAWDRATHVVPDGSGGVYAGGFTFGILLGQVSSGMMDAFVRRYAANGDEIWTRQFGTIGWDAVNGLATDPAGNLFVAGFAEEPLPGQDPDAGRAFLRKYDASGHEIWTRQTADEAALGVAADGLGITMVGFAGGGVVRRFDTNGAELWVRAVGVTAVDAAADGEGGVYVAGETASGDIFLRRYDAAGEEAWTRQFGTALGESVSAISLDATGIVYIAGTTLGVLPGQVPSGLSDAFVRGYHTDGRVAGTIQFGTWLADDGNGVAGDGQGGALVTGTIAADPPPMLDSDGDAYVYRLASTCRGTSNPSADESGVVSGPLHKLAEPSAGELGPGIHEINCEIVASNDLHAGTKGEMP